ncbi:hypothetical protein PO909_031812 [Leuciscus waleckii]
MSDLKVVSLNVKGINHVIKRQKILSFLKKERCQIAFLQETHLSDLEHIKLRRSWVGQVFYSSYNSKSRGVAILLHRSLPFTLDKTISDKEGRYVLLSGYLYGEHVVFGCIYAPTIYEASFIPQLISDLATFSSPYLLLGGDFNCTSDPNIDVSPPQSTRSKKSIKTGEFCKDLDLYDVWRVLHPLDKDYTFFSIPHQVFSRIDYFLSSRTVLGRIMDSMAETKVLSDHSPISVTISPPYRDPNCRHWRLDPTLLSNHYFTEHITSEWRQFISINKTPDISPSTLWEAGKAYIRGAIMSYTSAQRKDALKKQLDLEKTIATLEAQFKKSYSNSLAKQLDAARSALNQLLTRKAETTIFFAKHRLFESGNKPGRLLARLTRGKTEPNVIPSLMDRNGVRRFTSSDINKEIKLYYKDLYSSGSTASSENMATFLNKIKLPSLSDVQKADLYKPVSKEVVLQAIHTLKGGKAPGPDGFGPEFYKTFSQELVGPLTDMYLDSFNSVFLPPTLSTANISVILKKNKAPDMCGSYRPISLISVDSKLLSKLLARRLEKLLATLINSDQTGFVYGRYSSSNVRRLLNIIQFTSQYKQKALAVSLDAEKAFDRVEWGYLFDVLGRFGLGGDFLKWIKTIYHSPTAVVITNGRRSEPFPIARGVRQGCPLSPLLFALALEPLAETIQLHTDVKGITIGSKQHKIALYADDILIFLSSPQRSIYAIMDILNEFSTISGYRINFNKSEAMPLGALNTADVQESFPFKWSRSGFTYLGIKVSSDLKDLRKFNFAPICTSVKRDLERWQNLPLSLFGRISLIKMNVLPRLLYPLQMLPLYITKKINLDLEKTLSKFIWQGRKPRQKLKILQLPTDMGGLSMPNILFYNWACHARHFWLWLNSYISRETCIDSWPCHPHSPWSLITCEAKKINSEIKRNPIIYSSIRIWHDISKYLGRRNVKSLLSPITQNPDFPAGVSSSMFLSWRDMGIHIFGNLFKDSTLLSFKQLQETFNIPKHHFFGYLQIRHFVSSQSPSFLANISYSEVESLLLKCKNRKHLVAKFYSLLGSAVMYHLPDISHKWEKDLNNEYIEDDWLATIRLIRSTFTCNRLRETQYKILHRLHITPIILNKIDVSISPLCTKCNLERGTYYHYFWECKLISRFWTLISKVVSGIFKMEIKKDPGVFLLGLPSRDLHLNALHHKLLDKLLLSSGGEGRGGGGVLFLYSVCLKTIKCV